MVWGAAAFQQPPSTGKGKQMALPTATLHRKTSRTAFEQDLLAKYPNGVARSIYHEELYDGKPPQRLSLYYELLDNSTDRHCGTWTTGKGWEFLPEKDAVPANVGRGDGYSTFYTNNQGDDLSSCCDAFLTHHDSTLCCKKCWNEIDGVA